MKKKGRFIFIAIVLVMIIITLIDYARISNYPVMQRRPEVSIHLEQDDVYRNLKEGIVPIDWTRLDGTLQYIDGQYDCSDFRYVNLLRILYEFKDQIPAGVLAKIENTLFNFRYWWDDPGENSMCYWSENHQILFASAEYLVGQLYPEVVFSSSGLTGTQHMQKARERMMDWFEMRWNYGFIEYNSEVYYKEDIGALINIIDYADDEEMVTKARIIMDLLMYDVAVQNNALMMVSTSGRAYEGNRKGGPKVSLGGVTDYFWGSGNKIHSGMVHGMMYSGKYDLPEVIKEIARDTTTVIIKQKNGLNLTDLESEGFGGTDNRSMMMQWGMEAFSNHEIIANSMTHIRRHNMFSNDFIKDFRDFDYTLLRASHLMPVIARLLNPQTNGVAIQQGNTYTYKTSDYSLYTSQSYHPGDYGDQHHITGMNIGNHFSIFHMHPALEKDIKNQSPNYWVGYGHLPHAVQDERVSLAIYNIPEKKAMMEKDLLDYTHAYFPTAQFDSVVIKENYALGKKGNTYSAFIGFNQIELRADCDDDLVQNGKQSFWITEAGSLSEDGSFEDFCERIMNNAVNFDPLNLELTYTSDENNYRLKFQEDFYVNDQIIDIDYPRFDSPYVQAGYKPEKVSINHNGKSLLLDFKNLIREQVN